LGILLALAGTSAASPIYAVSSGDGRKADALYAVDAFTGGLDRIGIVEDGSHRIGLQSLAFSPSLGLYGVGHGELYHIDTSDGQATEIGPLGVKLTAVVDAPEGEVYGTAGDQLYSVDLSTGEATLIGSGNYHRPESLEFANGVLYATVGGGRENSLYEIDPATGEGTRVGRAGAIGFTNVEGLAFIDGEMYGFTKNGLEISINLANGLGSLIRDVGVGFGATAADPPEAAEPGTLWLAGVALAGLWRGRGVAFSSRRAQSHPPHPPPPS
jgi:hypothetical protein